MSLQAIVLRYDTPTLFAIWIVGMNRLEVAVKFIIKPGKVSSEVKGDVEVEKSFVIDSAWVFYRSWIKAESMSMC